MDLPIVPRKEAESAEKFVWRGGKNAFWSITSLCACAQDESEAACRVAFLTRKIARRSRPKQQDTIKVVRLSQTMRPIHALELPSSAREATPAPVARMTAGGSQTIQSSEPRRTDLPETTLA